MASGGPRKGRFWAGDDDDESDEERAGPEHGGASSGPVTPLAKQIATFDVSGGRDGRS